MLKKLKRVLFGGVEPSLAGKSAASPASPSRQQEQKKSAPGTETTSINLPDRLRELDISAARIMAREEHCISRKQISPNALKALYRLNDAGFHAFLVGGGVRDLLLKTTPKDFDISTNATPEEVRQLFRNARIIGRRFKIVHLTFGREIIEVTTFRAHHNAENEFDDSAGDRQGIKGLDSAHSSTGMILRDNVYGSINEDALRRDFTINALYYTTNRFLVIDFTSGLEDLEKGLIRMIGDPATRFREDPVRLLRAIRFSAKLDFDIEANTNIQIELLAYLLESVSSARLFDETIKLFVGGKAAATFALLRQYKLATYLFPQTLAHTQDPTTPASRLLQLALENTDNRLAEGKSVTPAFLYAALLWPPLQAELSKLSGDQTPTMAALQEAASTVIMAQLNHTAIPKRFTAAMREIWELQLRLRPRNARSAESIMTHPRFRAAYDFLMLREEAGEELHGAGNWWTQLQLADPEQQQQMLKELGTRASAKPRKRRRKRQDHKE